MAEPNVQLNDVGTVFRVECVRPGTTTPEDISAATALFVKFKKPSGSTLTKSASLTTDGTDGMLEYASQSGDLDEVGGWRVQGMFVTPLGSWHTATGRFKVKDNIN